MNKLFYLTVSSLFLSFPSIAAPALDCVKISRGDRSQILTNICNKTIEVAWCHNLDKKGYRSGLCGNNNKFYQKHTELDPGEKKQNKYTLPLGSRINYGACTGNYYTLEQTGSNGRFSCN